MTAISITYQNLEMLRLRVLADTSLSDTEQAQYLSTLRDVREGLETGKYTVVDRKALIKQAADKYNSKFRRKLKNKSVNLMTKTSAEGKSISSVDAFDEKLMYATAEETRRYADTIGLTDIYQETVRFDNEWN